MVSSVGMPIVDYKVATADQTQLLAQFQKSPQYTQDVAAYQASVGKIQSVDDLLGNYKALKFVLSAYNMDSAIDEKGLLKQLLTEDPTQSTSLAQKLGNQNYLAFAKTFWALSADGGTAISDPLNVNKVVARYGEVQFRQWIATRDNDQTLPIALNAQSEMQDAVDISDVGALYATFQQAPATQQTADYVKNHIASVTSPAALQGDPTLLNVALTAYGIDPASVSSDLVQQLLTQDPAAADSVAAKNPNYQAFANAFSSLQTDGGEAISASAAVTNLIAKYTQAAFTQALTANSADQNVQMFGAAGAASIARIVNDAKDQSGLTIGASYYSAKIGQAPTAQAFAADPQLVSVALTAYGLSSATTPPAMLQQLLTQDPTAADSVAQQQPQYAAFASMFSYAASTGGSTRDAPASIASVTGAYETQQLRGVLQNDIAQSTAQASRNTADGEAASAPLNLYQMLGDSDMSTVLLGAYGLPAIVGGYSPDQQIELLKNAGFQADSLSAPGAIDKLMQRYLVSDGAQSAGPADPVLSLFQNTNPANAGPITLDLSFLAPDASGVVNSPNGYLLSLFA